jgi:hypothetical protein
MSDIDKASMLFQAAGALAAPTRSGGLMESIGAAGTAVAGPLSKAAQAERDRQDKVLQLQMARAKLAADMGAGGVSASDMLALAKARADLQPKPTERERMISRLPQDKQAEAIAAAAGISEGKGELKEFTLPDGGKVSVLVKDGEVLDPTTNEKFDVEKVMRQRSGTDEAGRKAEAAASGIPMPERDMLRNLPIKKREEMRAKLIADGTKLLDKKETEAPSSGLEEDIRQTQRFLELNAENQGKTGPIVGLTPSLTEAAREMDKIGDSMARKMRQPGEGATSDYDAKMFKRMTMNTSNPYAVNRNIGLGIIAQRRVELERREFLRDYLSQNGTLDGAQKHWDRYLKDNPIFDKGQEKTDIRNVKLNPNRMDYRDYFREGAPTPRGSFVRGPEGQLIMQGQ